MKRNISEMPRWTTTSVMRRRGLALTTFLCWIFSSQISMMEATTIVTTTDSVDTSTGRFHQRPEVHCPDGCRCLGTLERSVSDVQCADVGLTNVPTMDGRWLPAVTTLSLTGNNISELRAAPFASARDLDTLTLAANGISELDPAVFHNLFRLRHLDLSGNRLHRLPPTSSSTDDLFASLANLLHLNLSGNVLDSLTRERFAHLKRLVSLDLSRNVMRHIPSNTFHGLESLDRLNLTGNNLTDLEAGSFAGLGQLSWLSLRANSLVSVEANVFYGMATLQRLDLSDNTIAMLSPRAFEGLGHLTHLILAGNSLASLPAEFTWPVAHLQFLDMSANPIVLLNQSQLSPGTQLREVDLSRMPVLAAVLPGAFSGLANLQTLNLSANPQLVHVSQDAFPGCVALDTLDLSHGGLETLHGGVVRRLANLKHLWLGHNHWRCDCGLRWLPDVVREHGELLSDASAVTCAEDQRSAFDEAVYHGHICSSAVVSQHSANVSFRVRSSALLECVVAGDPAPTVTWLTPSSHVLHWYPDAEDSSSEELATAILRRDHPLYHDQHGSPILHRRLHVLRNGNLFISMVDTSDAGTYVCLADNALGHHRATVAMTLDYDMLMHAKVVSILAGLALSVAFLLTMLVYQLGLAILNRWGWGCCCCCPGALPPKARHIRRMLESVEHYKTSQLERLRDNYNGQVNRIKDNCTQQMEKLRDSYAGQTERIRDIRDYGTQQIDRLRDQYYEQVRRVRDYSTQQMGRVRENYVSQRNRIRKFSAHQLFKLRENYKMQQLHLNKILENLNLESCRNVCARNDSTVFVSDHGFGGTCPAGLLPALPRLPSRTPSESDSLQSVEDFDGNALPLPPGLEPLELPPLPHLPVHHPLYLPPLEAIPEGDDPHPHSTILDMPPPPYLVALGYACSTSSSEGSHGGTVELAEVVTYIVDPSSKPSARTTGHCDDAKNSVNV